MFSDIFIFAFLLIGASLIALILDKLRKEIMILFDIKGEKSKRTKSRSVKSNNKSNKSKKTKIKKTNVSNKSTKKISNTRKRT